MIAMMGTMPIHEWPEEERPREKLLARGPTSLSDAELLALFLGSGIGGRDAVQTARDLLLAHGPLRVLLDRPARELSKLPGLGPARSCTLAAGLELPIATWLLNCSRVKPSATTLRPSVVTCSTACAGRRGSCSWSCSWTTATV